MFTDCSHLEDSNPNIFGRMLNDYSDGTSNSDHHSRTIKRWCNGEEVYLDDGKEDWMELAALEYGLSGVGHLLAHRTAGYDDDMVEQAVSNPDRLPSYPDWAISTAPQDDFLLKYPMAETDMNQLFDLYQKIFRWQPEERAPIDEIAEHTFFGTRNVRRFRFK
ncbi:hypothetical protein MFIFM68171_02190 [Madurella fahalii]|uniref:Uncharacterized protein n=1 Tax=Madurella fahalii TaxID=1157608 RepID=A0ABQ0G2M0_9PEZI